MAKRTAGWYVDMDLAIKVSERKLREYKLQISALQNLAREELHTLAGLQERIYHAQKEDLDETQRMVHTPPQENGDAHESRFAQ